MFLGQGTFASVYAYRGNALKFHKTEKERDHEVEIAKRLQDSNTAIRAFPVETSGFTTFVSTSPRYDCSLQEVFSRRYTEGAALFIIRQLKEAFYFLFKRRILHADASPSNVLVNCGLTVDQPSTTYYAPPTPLDIKTIVLADFGSAVDIQYERTVRTNVTFLESKTVLFRGPITTACICPPEFYEDEETAYTKSEVFKLDSWCFGILCALVLHYRENSLGVLDTTLFRLRHISSPTSRLEALWVDVGQLKSETSNFADEFHKYLLPKTKRAVFSQKAEPPGCRSTSILKMLTK